MVDGALCTYKTLLNQMIVGAKIIYKGEATDQVHTFYWRSTILISDLNLWMIEKYIKENLNVIHFQGDVVYS